MGVPCEGTSGPNQFMRDRFWKERKRSRKREKRERKKGGWEEEEEEEEEEDRGREPRGQPDCVYFANSPTFWFAAMERHYLQRRLW